MAAGFCLDMLLDPHLVEVWCDAHDDIVLVRGQAPHQLVEFVQVKSNDPNQYWSMALLTERDLAAKVISKTPANGATVPARRPRCLLEKSLAHDRCDEEVAFRVVSLAPLNRDLKLLTYPLGHEDRGIDSTAFQALCHLAPDKIKNFQSGNGNDYRFWLQRTLWETAPEPKKLERLNGEVLSRALEAEGHSLLGAQRKEIYLRLLRKVKEAGDALD